MNLVLGIETSCDETAAAVVRDGRDVLSNRVASQISAHSPYGGVVPELAAREHLKAIEPVVVEALGEAEVKISDLAAVAVTLGPGLMPSLLVGASFAKGLAAANDLPLIGVNHFLAHIRGAFLDGNDGELTRSGNYPMLALVVSGGHTSLILLTGDGGVKHVGQTLDDAVGEAFDKAAKLLNLGYPGGPIIEKLAAGGNTAAFHFPRSLTSSTGHGGDRNNRFNFSFSGLKTALLYHCRERGGAETMETGLTLDTIASYQEAIIEVLVAKTLAAVEEFAVASLVVSGGVACNNPLRERFTASVPNKVRLFLAPKTYCTDNAAMVAALAHHHLSEGQFASLDADAYPRLGPLTRVPFAAAQTEEATAGAPKKAGVEDVCRPG